MKAVLLDVPDALLEERRRLGLDKTDELWDGVLHMSPAPRGRHQRIGSALFLVLGPIATARGLTPLYDSTGLYREPHDYRIPDQQFVRPEHNSDRGTEGAELVVEIRSAGDDTYDKIEWYAARGVVEMLIVHPDDRRVELLRNVGGRLLPVTADADGAVRSTVLGVGFHTVDGPALRIAWADGAADV